MPCACLFALALSTCGHDDFLFVPRTNRAGTHYPFVVATNPSVAFMTDVHFENVYGDFKSTKFAGIPTKDGKNATVHTMYA